MLCMCLCVGSFVSYVCCRFSCFFFLLLEWESECVFITLYSFCCCVGFWPTIQWKVIEKWSQLIGLNGWALNFWFFLSLCSTSHSFSFVFLSLATLATELPHKCLIEANKNHNRMKKSTHTHTNKKNKTKSRIIWNIILNIYIARSKWEMHTIWGNRIEHDHDYDRDMSEACMSVNVRLPK